MLAPEGSQTFKTNAPGGSGLDDLAPFVLRVDWWYLYRNIDIRYSRLELFFISALCGFNAVIDHLQMTAVRRRSNQRLAPMKRLWILIKHFY